MCVAWIPNEIERGHHSLPSPRSERWPDPTIPHASPTRKRPSPSCSASSTTPTPSSTRTGSVTASQAACRLGGHRARALPAAEGGGERALLPAGHRAVLLPPVPRGGGTLSFLVPPKGEEAQALFGAPQTGDRSRAGGRSGDLACGLYLAGSPASAPGFPVGGFRRGRVGTLGFLQRLRGQAASPVRPQPCSHLLRAHPRQRRGRLPDRGTHQRGGFGRGSGEVSLGRPGLPE